MQVPSIVCQMFFGKTSEDAGVFYSKVKSTALIFISLDSFPNKKRKVALKNVNSLGSYSLEN